MKIKLIQGYSRSLQAHAPDGRVAVFPGKSELGRWRGILTGARNEFGVCRIMTAKEVRAAFRVTPRLQKPYDSVDVEDDIGLFGPIKAEDILAQSSMAHGIMPVAVSILAAAANGEARKRIRNETRG